MGWNWLTSVRLYLPSLPSSKEYDPFSGGKVNLAGACVRRGDTLFAEGHYDGAIAAYSEAIQFQDCNLAIKYKPALDRVLAFALNNRSCAFLEKAEYDFAIQDCNLAIKYKPDLALAFCNSGSAFLGKGDCERAIQDYNQALRLKPDLALALNNRGIAFLLKGNLGRAVQDYDRAVDLQPDLAMAFRNRGIAAFCDRRFPHAKKDCAEAVRLDPKDGHNLIWLYLASARDGKADKAQLEGQVTGLDLRKWPGPAVEFLLGSLTLEALLATSHHENLYKEREQRCAAHFFIGQRELLNGRLLEAANSFREVIASGAMNCLEYQAAEAELQDLNAE